MDRKQIEKQKERRDSRMKKISIMIPCYNEEETVGPMSEAVVRLFEEELTEYDYEILFIDNDSDRKSVV